MPCRLQSVNRLTGCGEQFLGHIVGDIAGQSALLLCTAEYFHRHIINARGVRHCLSAVIAAVVFVREIDHPAGIDDIVWRIKDAARCQVRAIFRPFQLIVGGAGNNRCLEQGNGAVVEFCAKRAR